MNAKDDDKAPDAGPNAFARYLSRSRDLVAGLLYCVPLFVVYQVGVLTAGGVQNGVDFVTVTLLRLTGGDMSLYLAVNLGVLVAMLVAMFLLRGKGRFAPELWPIVLVESTLYALVLGWTVNAIMHALGLDALLSIEKLGPLDRLVLAVGAGLYEELVFRLILLGGLYVLATHVFKANKMMAGIVCALISSVLFSVVHHIGNMADDFDVGLFLFRFIAGMVLAFLFWVRGLAVAVYTHAFYDVLVMVLRY